jgi:ribonuclease PH
LEIQGTAEGKPFSKDNLDSLFNIAKECVEEIFKIQN